MRRRGPDPCTGWPARRAPGRPSSACRFQLCGEMLAHARDRLGQGQVDELDAATAPELTLEEARPRLDGPGSVRRLLVRPQALEEDAEAPVNKAVAEEEEVAAAESGGKCDGQDAADPRL